MQNEQLMDSEEFASVLDGWQRAIFAAVEESRAEAEGETPKTQWALVGVKRRGAILARRLHEAFTAAGLSLLYGEVDISLYRDDYHLQVGNPRVLGTEIPFSVDGVKILLIDDVLFTGRTVRAAIHQLLDFGRPRVIQLAIFIDRGNRELPIAPDFVGKHVQTQPEDRVKVQLAELDGGDGVQIIRQVTK